METTLTRLEYEAYLSMRLKWLVRDCTVYTVDGEFFFFFLVLQNCKKAGLTLSVTRVFVIHLLDIIIWDVVKLQHLTILSE